jgi:hypothetical protein
MLKLDVSSNKKRLARQDLRQLQNPDLCASNICTCCCWTIEAMAYVRNNICASGWDEDTSVASIGKRLGCVEGSGWDGDRTVSSVSELTKL